MRTLKYDVHRYDEHLCLRAPVTLWVTLLFLSRHLLLLGITFLPTTGDEIKVLRDLIRPEYLIADLIALPVVIAAARRRPEAPQWMRWLWRRGRGLLLLAACCYLFLLGLRLSGSTLQALTLHMNETTLISALISVAIILYLARGELVRDVFLDWPTPSRHDAG